MVIDYQWHITLCNRLHTNGNRLPEATEHPVSIFKPCNRLHTNDNRLPEATEHPVSIFKPCNRLHTNGN